MTTPSTGRLALRRLVRIAAASFVLAWTGQTAAEAAPPRYAAFMIDANSREVLYANAADELRHPASLTKMMTLYLVFDALEAGRLRPGDPVPMSRHAASMAPSRLGLAVGQSISVDNAISVVAVKSANDVAVALAEKVGGSESAFVDMMNAKARMLGMRNTHFANACGLTDASNVTTARDLALLGLALIHDHPRYYRYFGERDFVWKRSTMINHNHLLGKMVGLDGIKTGYTADSGFTLAASAQRGNRRLIAVLLGEPSLAARSRDATALLEAGFSVMDRRMLGQPVTVASVLPSMDHPALRTEAYGQGDSDEEEAPAVSPLRAPALVARPHGRMKVGGVRHHGKARRGHESHKAPARSHSGKAKRTTAKSTSKKKSTHRHRR